MRKSRAKKYWYPVAYFDREGQPNPAHAGSNFAQWYGQLTVHRDTLQRVMSSDILRRGSYAAALWAGQLSPHDAVHGPAKPLMYVYEGGRVERP